MAAQARAAGDGARREEFRQPQPDAEPRQPAGDLARLHTDLLMVVVVRTGSRRPKPASPIKFRASLVRAATGLGRRPRRSRQDPDLARQISAIRRQTPAHRL